MTLHPVARLLIPAALLAILLAAPRRQGVPSGDAGPVPLVETGSEPVPDVPLEDLFHGMFPNGFEAMRASTCVAEQNPDAFWAMHDTLFAQQDVWKASRYPDQLFRSYAVVAGADGDAFTSCFEHARSADRVTAANALAQRSSVRSTPTFFVNGTMVQGALPLQEFRKVILQAMR